MASCKLLQLLALLSLHFAESHAQLSECGIAPLNARIVGGQDALHGSWPWQVSLQKRFSHACGGSLVTRNWVLTAAHCVSGSRPSMWQVSLGRHELHGSNTNTHVNMGVAEIFLHPKYDSKMLHDIALLRLSSPVKFTDYIRPVCLAASGSWFNNGTMSWVTGWGRVREGVPLPYPKMLQEVKVPVIGNRQCRCSYAKDEITNDMICSGVLSGGRDACQGDSGGPMVSRQFSRWIQSGIVRFGQGCARPNLPGVYTRVSQYQSWINSVIKDGKPGFILFASRGVDPDRSFICRRQQHLHRPC